MNYKVLYRKYRPDSFENLVGQQAIVKILKNSIIEDKIAHAYIFSGPRGTGKTSTARILAKTINCLNPKDGVACGKCVNCLNFNSSPDIIEIDAASNNGVDEIRELINNVKIMPTTSKYKVYIIDEVHMLSQSAFNALLLTLEEPPAHVIFILATTNLENVPITILSRCQKFDFKRINKNDILERMEYICSEEKIQYDKDALEEIATLSDGGMRDALSILDQLSKSSDKVTMDIVINEVGTISNKKIEDLIDALENHNVEIVEKIIAEFQNISINYKVIIKKLIDSISKRAVNVLKNGQKGVLSYDQYKNMIIELNDFINKINISVDPYVMLEVILLGYLEQRESFIEIAETKTVETKKEEVKVKTKEKKVETQKNENKIQSDLNTKTVDIRINNCFVNASKDYLQKVKLYWEKLQNEASNMVKGRLVDTLPVVASDKYMLIATTIRHKDQELNQELDLIENEFNKINNIDYKIIFVDDSKWQEEKQQYIKNLQIGYKYTLLEEDIEQSMDQKENNLEELATSIFGSEKIEIE